MVVAGSVDAPVIITPVAEPNVWFDPQVADMVFTAPWKLGLFPLDVAMKFVISDSLILRSGKTNSKYGSFIYSITRVTADFHRKAFHTDGIICLGAAGILYLTDPALFEFKVDTRRFLRDHEEIMK